MARLPWVAQIRNTRSHAEQIAALRNLKNEIVGHPLKKEMVVTDGALDIIVRLSANQTTVRQDGKAHDHSFAPRPLVEEETVRLQSLHVVASLALGGPAFLVPLQSAGALPAIFSNICPSKNPAQIVLASLRALSNFVDSSALASSAVHSHITAVLADLLFSRQHLKSLCRILSQSSSSSNVQSQITLAASLISRVCREERHQQALANSGVLDALATNLASFVVAEGLVIPGAEAMAQRDGLQESFPEPAPASASLSATLEAIAVIITDSKFRASQLLYSRSILAVFPTSRPSEVYHAGDTRTGWQEFKPTSSGATQTQLSAMDYLLPIIPAPQLKSSTINTSAFPPLSAVVGRDNVSNGRPAAHKYNGASTPSWSESPVFDNGIGSHDNVKTDAEEPESPLIAYLILLLRTRQNMERLMAAAVLTVLFRAGLTSKSKEAAIGLLVVPLLVGMLDGIVGASQSKDSPVESDELFLDWASKERAPAILAMLITDSEYLQKAAYDASALGRLSKMLKVAYDPVPVASQPQPWAPHTEEHEEGHNNEAYQLGHQGQSPLLVHKVKVRESTLRAIAALVPFKDEYRKAIVDHGLIPYIVESLDPHPAKPSGKAGDKSERATNGKSEDDAKQEYGVNPVDVLVAGCGAIRALSRSVSILRTTLIDNGIAMPVFHLLRHPDVEVQIAATAAVCNLVTDISPMRQIISEAGVLKILCEHAHSMNAKLRLNALWALKHFVHAVSNDLKRTCLEELGQGWLVQLICDDTEDEALLSTRGRIEAGNTSELRLETEDDVEMDQFVDEAEPIHGDSPSDSNSSGSGHTRSTSVRLAELRLAALREAETNPARKARKDDIAVQEQGLDFIRNLIGGAGQGGTNETTEMIDFLFNALGQDRVFEILASKLRHKVINPFNKRNSTPETRVIPPQPEIITAVGYILVHMAASVPRHRQLVIAQTELLKLLVPQFNHPNIEVRLALCLLVTNLTWMDDANDGQACAQRANELKKLGFLSKLEMLEQDPELNVRERAKSALWQMKQRY